MYLDIIALLQRLDAEAAQTEAGKRNAKADATTINSACRALLGLLSREDLEEDTIAIINKMIVAPTASAKTQEVEGDLNDPITVEITLHPEIKIVEESWANLEGETFTETLTNVIEGKFDKDNLVIENVKILGVTSRNGRRYPVEAQKTAVSIFEGAKAYLNHPTAQNLGEARDVRDLIGQHRNVRVQGDASYSDLHLLDNPTVRDYVVPVAEKAPHLIGNSIVVRARMKKAEDGIPEAQEILACRSIDIVSEPATTNGLYESVGHKENDMELKDLTLDILKKECPDLVKALLAESEKAKEYDVLKTENEALTANLTERDKKITALEAENVKREKASEIDALVREAKVPDTLKYEEKEGKKVIKSHILGSLERAANTEERQAFITDWETMYKPEPTKKAPQSEEQKMEFGQFKTPTSESVLALVSAVSH
jgi:hypothetical protein